MGSDCLHPVFQYADWQKQEEDDHCPVQPKKEYKRLKHGMLWNPFGVLFFILYVVILF